MATHLLPVRKTLKLYFVVTFFNLRALIEKTTRSTGPKLINRLEKVITSKDPIIKPCHNKISALASTC